MILEYTNKRGKVIDRGPTTDEKLDNLCLGVFGDGGWTEEGVIRAMGIRAILAKGETVKTPKGNFLQVIYEGEDDDS